MANTMKIILNLTNIEALHAWSVLHGVISGMGEDEPGEFYKSACRKIESGIRQKLDRRK